MNCKNIFKTDKMDGLPISESLTKLFCSSMRSINIIIYNKWIYKDKYTHKIKH